MKNDVLRTIQALATDILAAFILICHRHELRYFAIGGTCLGAVRHKGFIPWDDDIDVGMPRRDYNKFVEIAQDELPAHYFLQNYKTEPEYLLNNSKIRDNNTTFIETTISHMNMHHGIYIDIYPLDGVPADKLTLRILEYKVKSLDFGIYGHYIDDVRQLKLRSRVMRFIMKKMYTPFELHKKRDSMAAKYDYDQCDMVCSYFSGLTARKIVPREYFGAGTNMQFENLQVVVPSQYDKYLTRAYGDYMTPPPKEKQITHHITSVIDVSKPYTEYIK